MDGVDDIEVGGCNSYPGTMEHEDVATFGYYWLTHGLQICHCAVIIQYCTPKAYLVTLDEYFMEFWGAKAPKVATDMPLCSYQCPRARTNFPHSVPPLHSPSSHPRAPHAFKAILFKLTY